MLMIGEWRRWRCRRMASGGSGGMVVDRGNGPLRAVWEWWSVLCRVAIAMGRSVPAAVRGSRRSARALSLQCYHFMAPPVLFADPSVPGCRQMARPTFTAKTESPSPPKLFTCYRYLLMSDE